MRWATLIAVVAIVVEVIGIMQVSAWVGGWATFGLLMVGVIVGMQLSKMTGKLAMAEVERAVQSGKRPDEEIMGGLVTFLAAVLFIVPGFITDLAAIVLLLPPVRRAVARRIARRAVGGQMVGLGNMFGNMPGFGFQRGPAVDRDVIDVEAEEIPAPRPELGPRAPSKSEP